MPTKHFPALIPSLLCHSYSTRETACAAELGLSSQAVTCHVINSSSVLIIGEQKEGRGKSARGERNANMMAWDWMLKSYLGCFLVKCKFAFFLSSILRTGNPSKFPRNPVGIHTPYFHCRLTHCLMRFFYLLPHNSWQIKFCHCCITIYNLSSDLTLVLRCVAWKMNSDPFGLK